mmetsp:Transcript_5826/g.12128  ORF Transcript_5826/g.12128 Transcript_5826/m.12128 type:complete len:202 (-) Transcript_5826:2215-2820(-)
MIATSQLVVDLNLRIFLLSLCNCHEQELLPSLRIGTYSLNFLLYELRFLLQIRGSFLMRLWTIGVNQLIWLPVANLTTSSFIYFRELTRGHPKSQRHAQQSRRLNCSCRDSGRSAKMHTLIFFFLCHLRKKSLDDCRSTSSLIVVTEAPLLLFLAHRRERKSFFLALLGIQRLLPFTRSFLSPLIELFFFLECFAFFQFGV